MSIDSRSRPLLGRTRKKYQCLLTGRDGRMMRDFIRASAVPRASSPPLLRPIPSPPPCDRITQHLRHHHLHQCDRPVQYGCRHRCCHLSCHPIASTGTTVEICSAPTAREISTDSARSQGTLRTISPVQGRHRWQQPAVTVSRIRHHGEKEVVGEGKHHSQYVCANSMAKSWSEGGKLDEEERRCVEEKAFPPY